MFDRRKPAPTFRFLAGALLAVAALCPPPAVAQTDGETPDEPERWERQIVVDRESCDPVVREEIARRIRRGIERETRRGERSVTPPTPVAELTCLTDILAGQLPGWRVADPGDWVNHWIRSLTRRGEGLARSLCAPAEGMFRDFTRPLVGGWNANLPGIGEILPTRVPPIIVPDDSGGSGNGGGGSDAWPWLTPDPTRSRDL